MDLRDVSVSEATLAPEDLIAAFTRTLEAIEPGRPDEIRAQLAAEGDTDTPEYEEALLEALTEALEWHAPDGYSFGAHRQDGASFGYWRDENDEDLAEYEANL